MEWKSIKGFESYKVSEFGDVKTLYNSQRLRSGNLLKPRIVHGYRVFSLYNNKIGKNIKAHRAVALMFLPPKPFDRAEIAHNYGDKLNNHYTNLRWTSRKDNDNDRKLHGTDNTGERHGLHKLTEKQVISIRNEYIPGINGYIRLANKYNVSFGQIRCIIKCTVWKHLL